MKIGILTFHHGHNYGGFWQTYSFFCYLRQQYPDASVINYVNPKHLLKKTAMTLCSKNPFLIPANIKKALVFHKAHKNYDMTPLTFTSSGISHEGFDVVVLGSDEVWNFRNPMFGFDPTYFGYGIDAKKIISYAASFGALKGTEEPPAIVEDCLRKLDHISVRDKNTQEAVAKVVGRDVPILADPVFLHEQKADENVSEPNGYILIYSLKLPAETVEEIIAFAKIMNRKLVALVYPKRWCDVNVGVVDVFEWLSYFKNADVVITSMFHGAMFCVKYNKQFSFIMNDYRRFKVDYVFDFLSLNDRVWPNAGGFSQIFSKAIDYDYVNQKTASMANESKRYLQESIND
jgi:hypothetical protein